MPTAFSFTPTDTPDLVEITEYLDYLVMERVAELAAKVVRNDPECQQLQTRLESCYQVIRDQVAEPVRRVLIEEFQEAIAQLEGRGQELAYRQGLRDGKALKFEG